MPMITVNNGEKQFDAEAGISLLEALARQDIVLPSACGGRGLCGMCKVRVFSGGGPVTEKEQKKLTAQQFENKWRLACQTLVEGDLSLELPGQLIGSAQYECVVEKIEELTYDIKGVRLRLPEGKAIQFLAGQYMQLTAPPYGKLKKSVYRAYSIASAPQEQGFMDFCVRKVPDGIVTTWVHEHLQVGMPVTITGPYGEFYLRDSNREIIFIAGGSGLSPVQSIVTDMINRGIKNRPAKFFFGACTCKDLYYVDKFRALERANPWFNYIPALSNEEKLPEDCAAGLITEVVDRYYGKLDNHEAYLCGSPGMIKACLNVLTAKGLPESLVFYDKFA